MPELEPAMDCPGWGLLCELTTNFDPEVEEACPGWTGGNLPETVEQLRDYVHVALDNFQDLRLWGAVKEIWKGGGYFDGRRMNNSFRLQYANIILRNANRWLNRKKIFNSTRPNKIESENVKEAIRHLNELLIWVGGLCGNWNSALTGRVNQDTLAENVKPVKYLEKRREILGGPDPNNTAEAEPRQGGQSHLDKTDKKILRLLKKKSGVLLLLYDIPESIGSRSTAGNRINSLIECGLVHRPKGPKGGFTLTEKGQKALRK